MTRRAEISDRPIDREEPIKGQQRMLLLSWLTYSLAYTLRVNIAVVIPAIVVTYDYTYTQMGLVTSLYFTTYMGGQLINGYLGDRVSGKLLIICGLVTSALCNLGFALASSFAIMALFWAANGLAQSMLWAPLMKTLSVWFHGYQLERVSFIMALTVIIGYAFSWGLSSIVTAQLGWAYAFYLPAGLVLAFSVLMIFFFRSKPVESLDTTKNAKTKADQKDGALPLLRFIRLIHLPGLLLIAFTQGIIREGISIWFPTIVASSGRFTAGSPWLILVIVPLINFCGVLFVRYVNRFLKRDSQRTLLFVFVLVTLTALVLNLMNISWFWLVLLIIMLLLSLTYGLTPLLTSVIPFQYAHFRRVSLMTGLIDFSIYLGAAIAGIASGWIADNHPWNRVMLLWLAAALLGLMLAVWQFFKQKNNPSSEQKLHR